MTGWLARWDQQEVAPSLFDNICWAAQRQTWRTCSTFVMKAATCKEVHYTTLQLIHASVLQPAGLYNTDMASFFILQVVNDTAAHTAGTSAYKTSNFFFFYCGASTQFWGIGSPLRGFTVTIKHTTLGRTPLEEWSAKRRGLYLLTYNNYKIQTSMPPAGFEPKIPASKRPQAYASDRAVSVTSWY